MKLTRLVVCIVCLFFVGFMGQAFAGDSIRIMASIASKLNHYPSEGEKEMLHEIVDDSEATAAEKTIAQAMMNLQHTASASDKAKLAKIIEDNKQPQNIRDLAKIIHDMNHKPTDADKQKLKNMM